jgi:hypothetical protein
LSAEENGDSTWYVDVACAVHADMRSHTGGGLTMGKGFIISVTTGQKLNTSSLTEAELVADDDCMSLILWARHVLIEQMYLMGWNIILQDNKSSVLLEVNGKASSRKRTRHLAIRYFFIRNCAAKKECKIVWIPCEDMVADYLTKSLQWSEFCRFRDIIMGTA